MPNKPIITTQELKEKIERVSDDLKKMESSGDLKGIQALTMYKEYLEDELRMLEDANQRN